VAWSASLATENLTLYQQKFWKITELYTTYGSIQGSGALWGGSIESVTAAGENTHVVSWKAIEPYGRLFLPQQEQGRTGLATLAERFRTPISGEGVAVGFPKYAGWKLVAGGAEFSVTDASVEVTGLASGSDIKVRVTMAVQGNPGAYAVVGSTAYVAFGERFRSPFGAGAGAPAFAYIMTKVARGTDGASAPKGQPCLYMYGHYSPGYYELPIPLDPKKRISIASHFYGVDPGNDSFGVPMVWVTTRTGTTGVSYVEHGTSGRQSLLYSDPETDIMGIISADPGWSERRQKGTVRCGNTQKVPAGAAKPSYAYALTGMHATVQPPAGSGDIRGYFVCLPRGGTATGSYHSIRIEGYGGIRTPLTVKMGMDIPTTAAHPLDLPIETYDPVAKEGEADAVLVGVPVLAKASTVSLAGCGLDEVKDDDRFESLRNGEQLPAVSPSNPASFFEFSKARQVLTNVKQFNAHKCADGSVILFYGKDTGKFKFGDGATSNPSRPGLFVVKSGTDMDNWGSPKFDRNDIFVQSADAAKQAEWERPLMIAYDFEFAGSIQLPNDEFLLFGYAQARENGVAMSDKNHMFLGCYHVSLAGLRVGETHKCFMATAGASADEDTSVMFYFRPSHAQDGGEANSMEFGQAISGVPSSGGGAPGGSPADSCTERFVRVIGGSQSGVPEATSGYELSQEVVGPRADPSGMLSVFFRDPQTDTIKRLWSCSQGMRWEIDTLDDGSEVSFAPGTCPTAFGDLLLYFFGDSLYCKRTSGISAGVYDTKQELLDKTPVALVASDVVGHKIAVNVDPQGRVVVFYLSKSGHIQAATSGTAGQTWEHLQNW